MDKSALTHACTQPQALARSAIFQAAPDLTSATAPNVNFEGSKFVNARFDHMNLRNAKLDGAKFHNVKFGNSILIGATMVAADFSKADLSEVQGLQQAQLDTACGDSQTRLPMGLSLAYCERHESGVHTVWSS